MSKQKEHLNITINTKQPEYVTEFSEKLLSDYYLRPNETVQEAFARASTAYCYGNYNLAQRIYDYVDKGWFMFSSPVLSNAPVGKWVDDTESESTEDNHWHRKKFVGEDVRALPISCYLSYVPDTIKGQIENMQELAWLSVTGGGVGLHNGIRAVSDKAPGPIPYEKTIDANIGYYRQGFVRRGSAAYYLDISHPDIVEHIKFRVVTGGDSARKSDNRKNFHSAVNITSDFAMAVKYDFDWPLKCPHTGEVFETLKARYLWDLLLETREKTGEPYLNFIDVAQNALCKEQQDLGLKIHGSNICDEIHLATNEERTAVCCLSSVNLELYDEWKDSTMIEDLVTYLDNIIQFFIDYAPQEMNKAVYSAKSERSIGIGAMGFSSLLQKKDVAFESEDAVKLNKEIFSVMNKRAQKQNMNLSQLRGSPADLKGSGKRCAHLFAIAPNANSSLILGISPSIEPWNSNAFAQNTRAGTVIFKNKHLDKLLKRIYMGLYTELSESEWLKETWLSIVKNEGSVQHLDFLTQEEKDIFKSAWEIDQHWVVQHAEDRQPDICQGQSLNLFFPAGVDRSYVNSVHLKALYGKIIKGLYYLRSNSKIKADTIKSVSKSKLENYQTEEVCISCQG
ncbi:MAG: ribonucleoside-diphosphate reductase subunit alpha [Bacilli bacterium]|nr:ribonucleoside-diphosphate reductase subunit alpha [Bacilli bacterium]